MTTLPISASRPSPVLYENLTELYAAHETLLEKQYSGVAVVTMFEDVSGFIDRARSTGLLLYANDERSMAQALIDYWTAMLQRAGGALDETTLVRFNPQVFPELDDKLCPFVGLEAFAETQSHLFFGRQRALETLTAKIDGQARFIPVLGLSGSGKSSLVLAGLLPRLKPKWNVLPVIVPGAEPLHNLAAALKLEQSDQLRTDRTLLRTRLSASDERPACMVVDQFEEIFTLCTDERQRTAFVDLIVDLATGPGAPHLVILTMRSDYEDFVARYPALHTQFLNEVRVGSLRDEELREVIVRPAEAVGLKFEPGLLDMLVNDARGEMAVLPLLQFTLLKLWKARNRNRLTKAAYEKLGNVRFALSSCADALYDKAIEENQETMRRIFLRLVQPSSGVEVLRKRVRRAELARGEPPQRFTDVLDDLRREGLIRYTPAEMDEDSQVEIPHESLVRNWGRLRDWIDDQRANIAMRDRLERFAQRWLVYGRSSELLLDEGLIPPGWLESKAAVDLGVSDLVREFVTRSQAEIKRRRKSTVYRIVIGASVVVIVAVYITMSVVRAREQRQVAAARAREQQQELETARAQKRAADLQRDKATAEQRAYMAKKESDLVVEIRNGQIRAAEAKERALTEQLNAQTARIADLTRELTSARTAAAERGGELARALTSASAAENRLRNANQQIAELSGAVTQKSNEAEQIKESLSARIRTLERQLNAPPALPPLPPASQAVEIGESLSLARSNARRGSICCMVRKDGQRYILTLASVLGGNVGELVTQPAPAGGGTERIGILWKSGHGAALVLPLPGVDTDRDIPGKGKFFGTEDTPKNQPNIEMLGGGSGSVKGLVLSVAGGRITTDIRATAADLGAPVFNRSKELIGIVSAIEEQRAVLLPIDPILEGLGVTLDN
ncbi:MAG TPA: hypothetical protein VEO54_22635 [Thermoanaerobaculia bacterium]|nr:hypothetical protein [Thermoanaerobaculia bacterium]